MFSLTSLSAIGGIYVCTKEARFKIGEPSKFVLLEDTINWHWRLAETKFVLKKPVCSVGIDTLSGMKFIKRFVKWCTYGSWNSKLWDWAGAVAFSIRDNLLWIASWFLDSTWLFLINSKWWAFVLYIARIHPRMIARRGIPYWRATVTEFEMLKLTTGTDSTYPSKRHDTNERGRKRPSDIWMFVISRQIVTDVMISRRNN